MGRQQGSRLGVVRTLIARKNESFGRFRRRSRQSRGAGAPFVMVSTRMAPPTADRGTR